MTPDTDEGKQRARPRTAGTDGAESGLSLAEHIEG